VPRPVASIWPPAVSASPARCFFRAALIFFPGAIAALIVGGGATFAAARPPRLAPPSPPASLCHAIACAQEALLAGSGDSGYAGRECPACAGRVGEGEQVEQRRQGGGLVGRAQRKRRVTVQVDDVGCRAHRQQQADHLWGRRDGGKGGGVEGQRRTRSVGMKQGQPRRGTLLGKSEIASSIVCPPKLGTAPTLQFPGEVSEWRDLMPVGSFRLLALTPNK